MEVRQLSRNVTSVRRIRQWLGSADDDPMGADPAAPAPAVGIKAGREALDGEAGVRALGHREQIGGKWEEIGRLQFDFLLAQGLQPHHYYLDVACGALRGGVHLIPYLERGHYLGIEKEALLVEAGLREELGEAVAADKRPEIVISSTFEFDKLSARPDFALAQSLFTHLPLETIEQCLRRLQPVMAEGGVFFATFNEVAEPVPNPDSAHDWGHFQFTQDDMRAVCERSGWTYGYLGDWGHPRRQKMLRLEPRT